MIVPSARVTEELRALVARQAWPADYARLVEHSVLPAGRASRWPRLVLACAASCGMVSDAAVQAAAAAALLMAALDVFDDVEDGEVAPDVDSAVSVNVGTGLLLLFHQVCGSSCLHALPPGAHALVDAALQACGGQHRDLSCRADGAQMSPEEATAITAAKSATLVTALCRAGAQAGGARGLLLARYAAFGHHLDMALQLANDLTAVQGEPAATADLARCRPTLPLVYAAQCTAGGVNSVPQDALTATWVVFQAHRQRALRVLATIERTQPARALLEPFLP